MEELGTQAFWLGLATIVGLNIVLSGDNAVVIALAARSLPPRQQRRAIFWGAGAAVVLRIALTVFAVALLKLPWLKLAGGLLLFWIGIKLMVPGDGDGEVAAGDSMASAIRTILIADLVMSLDNVIAVAAAAAGSLALLILGLAISIPLVVFGATLLVRLMERYPMVITLGAALIGMVAGQMLVTDAALLGWMDAHLAAVRVAEGGAKVAGWRLELLAGAAGAALVVAWGTWLARRREASGRRGRSDAGTQTPNS